MGRRAPAGRRHRKKSCYSMIPKSGHRFSEKTMLKQEPGAPLQSERRPNAPEVPSMNEAAALATGKSPVTLDDKYTLESGRVYTTGIQALVRLPMMQRERDRLAGLNTGGFISGY